MQQRGPTRDCGCQYQPELSRKFHITRAYASPSDILELWSLLSDIDLERTLFSAAMLVRGQKFLILGYIHPSAEVSSDSLMRMAMDSVTATEKRTNSGTSRGAFPWRRLPTCLGSFDLVVVLSV